MQLIVIEDLIKTLVDPSSVDYNAVEIPIFEIKTDSVVVKSHGPLCILYSAVFFKENNEWKFKGILNQKT